jgi:hypothetical protein
MDVNEQIAKAYFEEVHGYIVKTNHYFKKVRKKGTGPSDIDLILRHPVDKGKKGPFGKRAICSVKGWQSHRTKLTEIKSKEIFKKRWKVFERDELKAADKFFESKNYTKILLVPPLNRESIIKAKEFCLKSYGIVLLDFSEVLFSLLKHLATGRNSRRAYDLEVLQTLRMVTINLVRVHADEIQLQENLVDLLCIKKDNIEARVKHKKIVIKSTENKSSMGQVLKKSIKMTERREK